MAYRITPPTPTPTPTNAHPYAQHAQIWRSADFGRTWTKTRAPTASYTGLAANSDATRLVAIAYGDQNVHMSSNEFSSSPTWTRKPLYTSTSAAWKPWMVVNATIHSWNNWRGVTSSAAGDRLAFISGYGFIYYSSNSGVDIHPNAVSTPAKGGVARTAGWDWWAALAASSDGKTLYAAEVQTGALYKSTNYGAGAWAKLNVAAVTC